MGAVKADHKRNERFRWVEIAMKQWDREDQAKEAAEVRRHNRAVKAHKMKRNYPNRSHYRVRISPAMQKFFDDVWEGVHDI